jgi:hypothetical protein
MADEERYGLRDRLVDRSGERAGDALYTFVACGLAIAVSRLAAYLSGQSKRAGTLRTASERTRERGA